MMGEIKEYRSRDYVRAERIETSETVFLTSGVMFGHEGDYLVHREDGVYYADGAAFEALYEPVPEEVSEARKFTPDGKTVEEVVRFFAEYPDEIDRVKELEAKGGSRKGIMEYEI
jgi:hypothetical protein